MTSSCQNTPDGFSVPSQLPFPGKSLHIFRRISFADETIRGSTPLSSLLSSAAGNPRRYRDYTKTRAQRLHLARCQAKPSLGKADRLLRFLMNGMLFAERAVFVEFDSVRIVFLILIIVVISLLTFGASQSDSGSTSFCHIFRLLKKLTPHMRSAN